MRHTWLLLLFVPGCFGARSYACEDTEQCVVEGVRGTCEASGYCSFPDSGCDSRRRYSPFAGDGLARDCVEGTGTTNDATSVAPTATSLASASTTDEQTSTGCTTDCDEPQWLWANRDADLGGGQGHGIARAGSRVLVTGSRDADADRTEAFVAGYDASSGERDASLAITADDGASGVGTAIAADAAGAYVVVGSETSTAGLRAFIARVDETTPTWTHRHDTLLDDEYGGVGLAADGRAIVAGRSGNDAIVHAYDAAGTTVLARTIPPIAPASGATLHAIAVAPGGTSWIAGALATGPEASDPWARRLQADGGTAFELIDADPAVTPDVARAIAGLDDGGFVMGGVVDQQGWLSRVASDTSQSARVLDDGEVHGLTLAPDGSVIATGWSAGAGRDGWLAAFSPAIDPTPLWQVTIDHAGLDDELHAVVTADDGVVHVAGFATDSDGPAPWVAAYAPR